MNSELYSFLANRRSIRPKHLTEPAPDHASLLKAVAAACAAPDHDSLKPYRFVEIAQDQREKLADLFEKAARNLGADDEKAQRSRSKALKGPGIVGFVLSLKDSDKVPDYEQILTAGAALEQFLLALDAQGFGGIVLSGSALNDKELQDAFCKAPGERLAAWITVGTPDAASEPREAPEELPLSELQI